MTDREKFLKTFDHLHASPDTLTEVLKMTNKTKQTRGYTKPLILVAAIVALVLALGVTAYAANVWGIRELWRTPDKELPEMAAELIEQRGESAATETWSARVTESLCDANNLFVTVTVSGGDKYIVIPTDAMPEDSVSVIGLAGGETLADYAAAEGKTLLLAGVSLEGLEDLGIFTQAQSFRNISDSELAILISAEKKISAPSFDAVCTVYVLEDGAGEVQRVEIPLTLIETPSEVVRFSPITPDTVPGLSIGAAAVTETPLGVNVSIPVGADDTAVYAIGGVSCDELLDTEGGFVREDSGWFARWNMRQGSIGDTLTVHFYGQNDELLGDVIFKK